jgi:hypothetical protein
LPDIRCYLANLAINFITRRVSEGLSARTMACSLV